MTPVEELRAAAALLRETAAVPQSPRWIQRGDLAEPYGFADATEAWITLMSPALAETLAAWLDGCADDLAGALGSYPATETGVNVLDLVSEPDSVGRALDLARLLNGDAR